jgi:sulfatase modifying factor 1
MSRTISLLAASAVLLFSFPPARAVTIQWSPVGHPGNRADTNPRSHYGAVGYAYNIGTYDVTNSQFEEFLNAKDPTGANTLGLYSPFMAGWGINYNAANANGSKYGLISGDGNRPVNFVTWYDAIRFANWLNNGQGNGDTETGAYTLLGGTPTPSNGPSITRNVGASVFLPSEDEWYKAAYNIPGTNSYYQYPTNTNFIPIASVPTSTPNSVNYDNVMSHLTDVGAYSGTTSPYGAFDMGGNVFQWNEALVVPMDRGLRGGSFVSNQGYLLSDGRGSADAEFDDYPVGFRVASVISVPEPSSAILAGLGFGSFAAWAWRRRKRFGWS